MAKPQAASFHPSLRYVSIPPMPLHIVIPGLLWPEDSVAELTRDLALPALHALLGRGRRVRQPAAPMERWLCESFGVRGDELPAGALRLLGDGGDPGDGVWLCADPSHLRFARGTLALDAGGPDIDAEEAARLVAALNQHLGDFGEFIAPHPRRWYLRMKHTPRIVTHPLSSVAGRAFEPFLPRGEDARAWRRFINEAQVLLHNHPVNAAREAAGKITANSLWPWGAGPLPASVKSPASQLHASDPLARGLARRAEAPVLPVPDQADPRRAGAAREQPSPLASFPDLPPANRGKEALPSPPLQGEGPGVGMGSGSGKGAGGRLISIPFEPAQAGELPSPPSPGRGAEGRLILLESLATAAQALDVAAWREGLMALETRWFAPLLAALKTRRIDGLRLTALGDDALIDITLTARDGWRFWRRPRTLAGLRS